MNNGAGNIITSDPIALLVIGHQFLKLNYPYDIYTGRHLEIIQKRKEAKSRTLAERKNYNRIAREQGSGL